MKYLVLINLKTYLNMILIQFHLMAIFNLPESKKYVCEGFRTGEKCKYNPVHHPFYL